MERMASGRWGSGGKEEEENYVYNGPEKGKPGKPTGSVGLGERPEWVTFERTATDSS